MQKKTVLHSLIWLCKVAESNEPVGKRQKCKNTKNILLIHVHDLLNKNLKDIICDF